MFFLELSIVINCIEILELCVLFCLLKFIKRFFIVRNCLIVVVYVLEYYLFINVEVINVSLRNSFFLFLRIIFGCKENLDILKNDIVYYFGNC